MLGFYVRVKSSIATILFTAPTEEIVRYLIFWSAMSVWLLLAIFAAFHQFKEWYADYCYV
jgi:hypothetical protein